MPDETPGAPATGSPDPQGQAPAGPPRPQGQAPTGRDTQDQGGQDGADDPGGDVDSLPEWARELVNRTRQEAARFRTRVRELEPLEAAQREREQAELTEAQRATQRAEAAERERDEARQEATRLRLAARYGLQEDDLDLLGTGTDEVLEGRAKRLAERLGGPAPSRAGGRRLPTERLIPTHGAARTDDDLSPLELSRLIRGGGSV